MVLECIVVDGSFKVNESFMVLKDIRAMEGLAVNDSSDNCRMSWNALL